MTPVAETVTGAVLAGGLARRMQDGGPSVDKGLLNLHGRPLIAHAVDRLAPQVDDLVICANRHVDAYARFGPRVVQDAIGGFAGPLAGLHAAMLAADGAWVVVVPCDAPYFPPDLVATLLAAARREGVDVAVARADGRVQPVFVLARTALRDRLATYLEAGHRRADGWYAPLPDVVVDFDDPLAFININTREALARCEHERPPPAPIAVAMPPSIAAPGVSALAATMPELDPAAVTPEAAAALLARLVVPVTDVETVPLRDALDRILAADLPAPIDVPAHDSAAMDGYALRVDDLAAGSDTGRLPVTGIALAGRPFGAPLPPGTAVRIMTGAVMPDGADTVVPQESVSVDGDRIAFALPLVRGRHRRRRGEDLARGAIALPAGRRLSPADIGLLASLGLPTVGVRRRLRVAVLSTGDELLGPGAPARAGHVYDSNRQTLQAMLRRLGTEPIDLGIVADRPDALEATLRRAGTIADAVISSGGVSVGDADFTRAVMARLGDVAFWSLAIRPGRPMAVGRIGHASYFGLPGNPVAVIVTFLFIVRDALLRQAGAVPRPPASFPAIATMPIAKRSGRVEYARGLLGPSEQGLPTVRLSGDQGSGMLRSISEADCIIVLAAAREAVGVGERVDVIPFAGLF